MNYQKTWGVLAIVMMALAFVVAIAIGWHGVVAYFVLLAVIGIFAWRTSGHGR